jgi:hypothetical protein
LEVAQQLRCTIFAATAKVPQILMPAMAIAFRIAYQ